MGLLDLFRLRKSDLNREPPPKEEWPDYVISLDKRSFNMFIEKYPLSLVDFWAPWCSPCKKVSPRVRRLSKLYKGKVAFGKLNISENKDIANQYHIMSIPNLVFFCYGKKVTSLVGVKSIGDIKGKINSILKRFEN